MCNVAMTIIFRNKRNCYKTHYISGEYECEVTPVPIPNTEVKLDIADDSWGLPPVKIGFRQFFYIPL